MQSKNPLEGYSLFSSFGKRYSKKITVRSNGVISFSSGIIKAYNIQKGTSVQVFYNPQEKKIALKFIQGEADKAKELVVQHSKDKTVSAAWLNARSFFAHNGIELPLKGAHFETNRFVFG